MYSIEGPSTGSWVAPNLPHIPVFKPLLGSLYMCASSNSHSFPLVFVLKKHVHSSPDLRNPSRLVSGLRRYSSRFVEGCQVFLSDGMHIFSSVSMDACGPVCKARLARACICCWHKRQLRDPPICLTICGRYVAESKPALLPNQ